MFRSILSFFGRGYSEAAHQQSSDPPHQQSSDPPPEYQTFDPLFDPPIQRRVAPLAGPLSGSPVSDPRSEPLFGRNAEPLSPSPSNDEQEPPIEWEDTPRNRFDYHVALRKYHQVAEWQAMGIRSELYGDPASQEQDACDWVIDRWMSCGIWASTWPIMGLVIGPEHSEKWLGGDLQSHSTCLLSMELEWEMDHLLEIQRPVYIPSLRDDNHYRPRAFETPLQWPLQHLARTALNNVNSRWMEVGFVCAISQPRTKFRRDMTSLYRALPMPARKRLYSLNVCCWNDLRRSGGIRTRVQTVDFIGRPIEPYPTESVIEGAEDEEDAGAEGENVSTQLGDATTGDGDFGMEDIDPGAGHGDSGAENGYASTEIWDVGIEGEGAGAENRYADTEIWDVGSEGEGDGAEHAGVAEYQEAMQILCQRRTRRRGINQRAGAYRRQRGRSTTVGRPSGVVKRRTRR